LLLGAALLLAHMLYASLLPPEKHLVLAAAGSSCALRCASVLPQVGLHMHLQLLLLLLGCCLLVLQL
jgi:hypothetical protein